MIRAALLLLLLPACVSIQTNERRQQIAYHEGRSEVIRRVHDLLTDGLSERDLLPIIQSMMSGEKIWTNYHNPSTERTGRD